MVGGLVEQQHLGRAHQRAGQLQPHAPAAREAVDRRVDLLGAKAQAEQQRLGARARVEGARFVKRQVRVGDGLAVVSGLRGGEFGLRGHQRRVALQHEGGGAVLGLRHVLGNLAHAPARRDLDVARIGVQAPGQQREEARLAGAVAADQADLLARLHDHAGVLENHLDAAAQGEVSNRDHRARPAARRALSPPLRGSERSERGGLTSNPRLRSRAPGRRPRWCSTRPLACRGRPLRSARVRCQSRAPGCRCR